MPEEDDVFKSNVSSMIHTITQNVSLIPSMMDAYEATTSFGSRGFGYGLRDVFNLTGSVTSTLWNASYNTVSIISSSNALLAAMGENKLPTLLRNGLLEETSKIDEGKVSDIITKIIDKPLIQKEIKNFGLENIDQTELKSYLNSAFAFCKSLSENPEALKKIGQNAANILMHSKEKKILIDSVVAQNEPNVSLIEEVDQKTKKSKHALYDMIGNTIAACSTRESQQALANIIEKTVDLVDQATFQDRSDTLKGVEIYDDIIKSQKLSPEERVFLYKTKKVMLQDAEESISPLHIIRFMASETAGFKLGEFKEMVHVCKDVIQGALSEPALTKAVIDKYVEYDSEENADIKTQKMLEVIDAGITLIRKDAMARALDNEENMHHITKQIFELPVMAPVLEKLDDNVKKQLHSIISTISLNAVKVINEAEKLGPEMQGDQQSFQAAREGAEFLQDTIKLTVTKENESLLVIKKIVDVFSQEHAEDSLNNIREAIIKHKRTLIRLIDQNMDDYSDNKNIKSLKGLGLKGKDIIQLVTNITNKEGMQAISKCIDNPSSSNVMRVLQYSATMPLATKIIANACKAVVSDKAHRAAHKVSKRLGTLFKTVNRERAITTTEIDSPGFTPRGVEGVIKRGKAGSF